MLKSSWKRLNINSLICIYQESKWSYWSYTTCEYKFIKFGISCCQHVFTVSSQYCLINLSPFIFPWGLFITEFIWMSFFLKESKMILFCTIIQILPIAREIVLVFFSNYNSLRRMGRRDTFKNVFQDETSNQIIVLNIFILIVFSITFTLIWSQCWHVRENQNV